MNYFEVNFSYRHASRGSSGYGDGGSYVHISLHVNEQAENEALCAADKVVTDALKKAGIEFKHSYMWPDGSLYKRFKTELSKEEFEKYLAELIPEHKPNQIYELNESRYNHQPACFCETCGRPEY